MTIKTWRNDILKICKKCVELDDNGRNRHGYKCGRYAVSPYKAYKCKKLTAVMKQAAEVSKQALDKAFHALTTMNGKLEVKMKIIVKDAQEASKVADILKDVAGAVWFDMNLPVREQEVLSDYLYAMRETIEVEKSEKLPADIV